MIHKIFTIHDVKATAYLIPFFLPERGQALRTFTDCVNDKKHAFGRHPGDYTLFEIGHYNDKTGMINMAPAHENLGNGLQFVGYDEPDLKETLDKQQKPTDVNNQPTSLGGTG